MSQLNITVDLDRQVAINACKRSLAKESFLHFVQYIKERRGQEYIIGKHILEITSKVDRALTDVFIHKTSRFLRISLPFRHGKSELISRYLTPYIIGKYGSPSLKAKNNPHMQELEGILGTYGSTLSKSLSRDARGILDSEEYREVFPEISLSQEASSTEDWDAVVHKDYRGDLGQSSSAPVFKFHACGMLGGVTGKGASCVVGSTSIRTNMGQFRIDQVPGLLTLFPGLMVEAYDLETQLVCFRRILGFLARKREGLVRIEAGGPPLTLTADHLVYSPTTKDYHPAGDLKVNDLVRLRGGEHQIEKITTIPGTHTVWDIQVDRVENFFADGVLVHNCLLFDDYLKNRQDAESLTIRERLWNAFKDDFMTRRAPVCLVIMLATRWHLDDIIGRVEERNNPESEHHDPEFPHFDSIVYKAKQDDGTYLFPERFSPDWYVSQAATLGPYSSAALLQSEPIAKGGNLLPTDKIRYVDSVDPKILERALPVRFWDLASSEQELVSDDPDATSGPRGFVWFDGAGSHDSDDILKSKAYFFVTDLKYIKALAPTRNAAVMETAKADGPLIYQGVEAQGGYKDAASTLKALLKGKSVVHPVTVHRAKFVRIEEYLHPIMDAGRVVFVRGWWNSQASLECSQFPGGKHDDIPDSLASCFKMAFERARLALRSGYVGGAGLSSGRGLRHLKTPQTQAGSLDNEGLTASSTSFVDSLQSHTQEEVYNAAPAEHTPGS